MEKNELLLLNLERYWNNLKYELYRLKFENRELKKEIKKLTYNNNETSESSSEQES